MNFDTLYKEHVESVRRVCNAYLKSQEDAEDATQDTFFKASQSLDSFNDNSNVGTWLISIAKNVCSDKLKARKKEQKLYNNTADVKDFWSDSYQNLSSPEAELEAEQDASAMLDVFNQLNSNERNALTLRYVDDLSFKQVAEHLGIPIGTAKTWVHRGRTHLLGTISPQ